MHLVFQFAPEGDAAARMKLKVEINTREHEPFYPLRGYPFSVANPWYSGDCEIHSYEPDELFGTKLRALLQRNKNRDLFDLWQGLRQRTLNPGNVVRALQHYLECGQTPISRANAEERMLKKLTRSLSEDVAPLLPPAASFTEEEAITAFGRVWRELIALIPGEPWKRSEQVIERLRATRLPKLLS
jgi:predicted nucleotidyltransferase component of viral defense system